MSSPPSEQSPFAQVMIDLMELGALTASRNRNTPSYFTVAVKKNLTVLFS